MIIQTTKTMRERDDFDHYPTPIELCRAALLRCPLSVESTTRLRILDPGAGTGVWGEAAREIWPNAEIHGIELREMPAPKAYDHWRTDNYMLSRYTKPFDLIMGNPPYGDLWEQRQRKLAKQAKKHGKNYRRPSRPLNEPMADAEAFVNRSFWNIAHGGFVVFLLRLAFLEGQERCIGLWRQAVPFSVLTLSRRPSFTGNGKTDATAYAVYYWQPGIHYEHYRGGWLRW